MISTSWRRRLAACLVAGALGTPLACTADPGSTASSEAAPTSSGAEQASRAPADPSASAATEPSGTAFAQEREDVPLAADGTVTLSVPALEVRAGATRDRSCFVERESDIGLMEFYLDAAVDLELLRMELIDPQGVRLVGEPVLVPAVNRGGLIAYGGTVDWDDRAEVLRDTKFVEWTSREPAGSSSPIADSSYLVLLRVAPTGDRVTFGGLRVDYEVDTPDGGRRFTTEATTDLRWRIVESLADCR